MPTSTPLTLAHRPTGSTGPGVPHMHLQHTAAKTTPATPRILREVSEDCKRRLRNLGLRRFPVTQRPRTKMGKKKTWEGSGSASTSTSDWSKMCLGSWPRIPPSTPLRSCLTTGRSRAVEQETNEGFALPDPRHCASKIKSSRSQHYALKSDNHDDLPALRQANAPMRSPT